LAENLDTGFPRYFLSTSSRDIFKRKYQIRYLNDHTERFTAKFAYGGLVSGSNQFTLLPKLPLKTTLDLKVVKIDSKIIICIH